MVKTVKNHLRGEKTRWPQKRSIVEWLEVPENFKLIVGAASEGKNKL
jgi:hypothetical protein